MFSDRPIEIENARLAREIICSKDFKAYPMAQMYRKLQKATSIDFSATITLMLNLPIYMNGIEHKRARKRIAERIAKTKAEQEHAALDTLHALHENFFTRPCKLDLLKDFAHPLWRSVVRHMVDLNANEMDLVDDIPRLFTPTLAIRKRIAINQQLDKILRDRSDEFLVDIALTTLGVRPFTGSYALSLYALIRANPDMLYSKLPFEQDFHASVLTFVDRIAIESGSVDNLHYEEGDHMRCKTQSDRYSKTDNFKNLYGFGSHVCLGRSISQYTIRQLPSIAKAYPVTVRCGEFSWQKSSSPFSMPASAFISVHM